MPANVLAGIKAEAEKDYPNDYRMQKFIIDQQIKGYEDTHTASTSSAVAGMPANVLAGIKAEAEKDYPNDYRMQKFMIDQQIKGYKDLNH